ncbi:hypothetical protein TWF106_011262 [Orbilia oligospora]|uniref:Uncharacterized protein n=1 Tax=Orbilia oligospora TaxID=2813651 RepID=A0A6G1MH91_ORBOL|nr:hypothetical protein TWF788_002945 [Orbilia oligospora]KAF3226852.1 hypothetical protein TWF106_011262 [Orbilia oligospora]KAF3258284.1 hypothetical protein TWF192_000416 [Orbilia oligospora]
MGYSTYACVKPFDVGAKGQSLNAITCSDNGGLLILALYGEYENVQYLKDFEMSTMTYCSGQMYQIARELNLYFNLIGLEFGVRLRTIPSVPAAFDENRPAGIDVSAVAAGNVFKFSM